MSLISIIIPVFNREAFITSAIESLLFEKDVHLDIIVVDDGSTDGTIDKIKLLQESHPHIRLISQDHGGVTKARNRGLKEVSEASQYISFLDSDDLNVPGRLKRQLKLLEASPHMDCVIGLLQLFEKADETIFEVIPGSRTITVPSVSLTTILFKKSVFDQLGIFNEDLTYGEDFDFYMRLMEAGTPYIKEDDPAVLYRRHSNNMTNDILPTRKGFMKALHLSIQRRRATGFKHDIGDLFKSRLEAEQLFHHDPSL